MKKKRIIMKTELIAELIWTRYHDENIEKLINSMPKRVIMSLKNKNQKLIFAHKPLLW